MHKINFNEDFKMTDKTQRRYSAVLMWLKARGGAQSSNLWARWPHRHCVSGQWSDLHADGLQGVIITSKMVPLNTISMIIILPPVHPVGVGLKTGTIPEARIILFSTVVFG